MKSYIERFKDFVAMQHLFAPGQQVLLAVSGGRDSVCLAHLMKLAGFSFAIAHVNFHLRGDESQRDQRFVQQLADRLRCECHLASFDTRTYAASHHLGVEEAARQLRYSFFASLCREKGYDCVATAHHRDDSVETFFLNLFRGTGIAGLHGIRPRMSTSEWGSTPLLVVRPMLCFSRADIDAIVALQGYPYVHDATHASLPPRRNQIRLQLMPLLRQLYPAVDQTMLSNMHRLAEAEMLFDYAVDSLRRDLVRPVARRLPTYPGDLQAIDLDRVPAPQHTILRELLAPFGANDDVVRCLLDGPHATGALFTTSTHHLLVDRGRLLIGRRLEPVQPSIHIGSEPVSGRDSYRTSDTEILVDADRAAQPFTLRRWQPGDRICPFGLDVHRKVSDVLKDKKINLIEKQHLWLLVDATGAVVWAVGLCADNRFRVTADTRRLLRLALKA